MHASFDLPGAIPLLLRLHEQRPVGASERRQDRLYRRHADLEVHTTAERSFERPCHPIAGLANFGTRLKAVFNNVPTGLRLYVSVANVDAPPAVPGGSAANTGTTGFAQLTATETGDEFRLGAFDLGDPSRRGH